METGVDTENARGKPLAPRRRRFAAAVLLLLLATGVAAAIALGTRSPSLRATANPGSASGAATVQRRDLVESDTESGTLGYADPQTVYNRLSGTVTWLPAVGVVIEPGQTLYGVSGRRVVLFDGALAAYRALNAKDNAGLDILQLNRDLAQMGFADGEITIDDAWQTATTDAVKRWQASLGETQTGTIALGRIVFLPGPQRVTQLDTTCGSTGGGSGSGLGSGSGSGPTNGCGVSEASATAAASHPEFVDFTTDSVTSPTTTTSTTTTTTPAPTTTTGTTTAPTSTTPKTTRPGSGHKRGGTRNGSGRGSHGRKASGSGSGHSSGSGEGSSGSGSGKGSGSGGGSGSGKSSSGSGGVAGTESASAILQTTSTKLLVTVDLAASSQSEAVVGSHVTVEMPDGSNVSGTITAVSAVAQNSSSSNSSNASGGGSSGNAGGSGSSATVPVTITLDERVRGAGLDQAAVSVNFVQEKEGNVLSVPVTALIATAGQSYAVQDASPPYKLIPVTTGLFAAGYVQISGAGVHSGLQVTDSQG